MTTVETLLTYNDSVISITFEDLGARNQEAICMGVGGIESMSVDTLAPCLLPEGNALVVVNLLDGVRLSCCVGPVALDIVASIRKHVFAL